MSKNVLGRGLGSLMAGDKPAEKQPSAPDDPSAISPGVESLFRGKRNGDNVFAENSSVEERPAKPLIPPWYFFVADVLLIAFALVVFYRGSSPLRLTEAAICVGAIVLAAILGVLGVCVSRSR